MGETLVVGFGVTGAGAAHHLLDIGTDPADLVVVDRRPEAVEQAGALGVRGVVGDGTRRGVLVRAISRQVRHVVVAVVPDAAAVLSTMVARDLCPTAVVATAVRDSAHIVFVRRHGADHVVITSEEAGQALGDAVHGRHDEPLARGGVFPWVIDQRSVQPCEVGRSLPDCARTAVGVLRGDQRYWGVDAARLRLSAGDRIVFLRTQPLHLDS